MSKQIEIGATSSEMLLRSIAKVQKENPNYYIDISSIRIVKENGWEVTKVNLFKN